MFMDIRERLDEPEIRELLAFAVYDDPDELQRALDEYKMNRELEVYALEEEGDIVGIAGIQMSGGILEIRHIAVEPISRGLGYGRGLILELIEQKRPAEVVAETDDEAVDFYRNIGFTIHSLGERYPGVERFKCTYRV